MHCHLIPHWHEVLSALPQLTECSVAQCTEPTPLYTPSPDHGAYLFLLPLALAAASFLYA